MPIVGILIYIAIGLLQLAAIQAGLSEWLGLPWIITIPLSLFLAYVPIVGTVLGFMGAINVWQWDVLAALLLFFGGLALALVLGALYALKSSFGGGRAM